MLGLERSVDEKNVKIGFLMDERDKNIQKHRDEIRELEKRLSELSIHRVEVVKTTVRQEVSHLPFHAFFVVL